MRCLNDPRKVLLRHDLLTKLAENGINRFRVRRATESKPGLRFPLFVREENAHTGPLTPLLRDSRSLSRALLALRMRGHRTRDLLVIEHENLADQAGLIRKAAAFKVGDTIVAAHLLISRDWIIKWGESIWTEETLRSHLEYATANPHRHWLEGVFSLGGIDYGRCDYGICGEIKEVWEINLNATIGFGPGPTPPPLRPELEAILDQIREVHHGRLQIAFRDLDPEQSRERITIKLDPAVVAKARAERARQRRRAGFWRLLHSAYASPVLGWPFRAAYAKFLPGPSRAR